MSTLNLANLVKYEVNYFDMGSHFPYGDALLTIDRETVRHGEIEAGEDVLDRLFEGFNRGSGHEMPELDGIRSMSVGDSVRLYSNGGILLGEWACAPQGWEVVPHE